MAEKRKAIEEELFEADRLEKWPLPGSTTYVPLYTPLHLFLYDVEVEEYGIRCMMVTVRKRLRKRIEKMLAMLQTKQLPEIMKNFFRKSFKKKYPSSKLTDRTQVNVPRAVVVSWKTSSLIKNHVRHLKRFIVVVFVV